MARKGKKRAGWKMVDALDFTSLSDEELLHIPNRIKKMAKIEFGSRLRERQGNEGIDYYERTPNGISQKYKISRSDIYAVRSVAAHYEAGDRERVIAEDAIQWGHLVSLARLDEKDQRRRIENRIVEEGLGPKATKKIVEGILSENYIQRLSRRSELNSRSAE